MEVLAHAPGRHPQTTIALATRGWFSTATPLPELHRARLAARSTLPTVTESLLKNLSARATLRRSDKRDLPHGRTLTLRYWDGTGVRIVLDQGVGYWRPMHRGTRFDFQSSAVGQAEGLRSAKLQVQAASTHRTWIVVTRLSGRHSLRPA